MLSENKASEPCKELLWEKIWLLVVFEVNIQAWNVKTQSKGKEPSFTSLMVALMLGWWAACNKSPQPSAFAALEPSICESGFAALGKPMGIQGS